MLPLRRVTFHTSRWISKLRIPQMKPFSQKQEIFCVLPIIIFAKDHLMIFHWIYMLIHSCEINYSLLSDFSIEDWMAVGWISEMKLISRENERSLPVFGLFSLCGKGGGRLAKREAQSNRVLIIIILVLHPCLCPQHVLSIFSSLSSSPTHFVEGKGGAEWNK